MSWGRVLTLFNQAVIEGVNEVGFKLLAGDLLILLGHRGRLLLVVNTLL